MNYSIRQAVYDTLKEQPLNKDFRCMDFFEDCRANMRRKNVDFVNPFDSTIQRRMREFREDFGLICTDPRKSIYRCTKEVKHDTSNN